MMNFFRRRLAAFGGINFFWSTAKKDLNREKPSRRKKFDVGGGENKNVMGPLRFELRSEALLQRKGLNNRAAES
jgi:hypothetical protein